MSNADPPNRHATANNSNARPALPQHSRDSHIANWPLHGHGARFYLMKRILSDYHYAYEPGKMRSPSSSLYSDEILRVDSAEKRGFEMSRPQ